MSDKNKLKVVSILGSKPDTSRFDKNTGVARLGPASESNFTVLEKYLDDGDAADGNLHLSNEGKRAAKGKSAGDLLKYESRQRQNLHAAKVWLNEHQKTFGLDRTLRESHMPIYGSILNSVIGMSGNKRDELFLSAIDNGDWLTFDALRHGPHHLRPSPQILDEGTKQVLRLRFPEETQMAEVAEIIINDVESQLSSLRQVALHDLPTNQEEEKHDE